MDVAGKPSELSPQETQFFETKVRPVLAEKCYKCHSVSAGKAKGGLVLDSARGLAKRRGKWRLGHSRRRRQKQTDRRHFL